MGIRRRRFRFSSGLNGVDRYYYPYRFTPPELGGSRYLDISPEMIGQDSLFLDSDSEMSITSEQRDDSVYPGNEPENP